MPDDALSVFLSPNGVKNTPLEIKTPLAEMSLSDTKALALKLVDSLVNLKDTSGEYRVPLPTGGYKVDSKSWNNWEWTQGVGLYGMWMLFEITGDESVLAHIQAWFDQQFAKGTPTKNVNSMAPMLTLAYLYERTGKLEYRAYLDSWAEFIMNGIPRTEGEYNNKPEMRRYIQPSVFCPSLCSTSRAIANAEQKGEFNTSPSDKSTKASYGTIP
jgi:hypothetical protein